jgi:proteic killer suppression protein
MAIRSFSDNETELLFRRGKSRRWQAIRKVALRNLDMLDAAVELAELNAPPGNRLEALHGDRNEQNSIRINDQYRLFAFVGHREGPEDVHIVDYH